MNWIKIIGFTAAILSTIAFLPQFIKTYKTKRTRDLSWGLCITMVIATFLWTVYGLLLGDISLIFANAVTFTLTFLILLIKIKNR